MRRRGSPTPSDPVAALVPAIVALTGRAPRAVETQRFGRYLRLLMEWDRIHRLTAIRSADGIVTGLFQDSLLFLAHLPSGSIRMADLGTGPGIPGIPLRIMRDDIRLTVVESRRKRVSFLSALKRELELTDLVVLEGRAEELVKFQDLAEGFDVVVARAVGISLLPIAMSYLRPGGLFLAGGPPGDQGATESGGASHTTVWQTTTFERLRLRRTFLVMQKPT